MKLNPKISENKTSVFMAFLWLIILLLCFVYTRITILSVTDLQEQQKLWANFGMMLTTVSLAFLMFYLKDITRNGI
jgi:hypothetical protein